MKTILLYSLLFPVLLNAQVNELDRKSDITDVTVFTNAAQVSRVTSVSLKDGINRVKLTDLSPFINGNSVQVSGFQGTTIISVNYGVNYLADKKQDPLFEQLIDERDDLIFEREKYRIRQSNLQRELSFIFANKNIKSDKRGLNVEDLMDISDFYKERLPDIKRKMIANDSNIKKFTEKINQINKQLSEIKSNSNRSTGEIEVTIKSNGAQRGKLKFNYIVRNAGWYPIYDIRSKEVGSDVDFAYKAMVYQRTGNEWNNVKLQLSTGDPDKGSTPPTLGTWRLYAQSYTYKKGYGNNSNAPGYYQQSIQFESDPNQYRKSDLDQIIADTSYSLRNQVVTGVLQEQGNSYNWSDGNGNYPPPAPKSISRDASKVSSSVGGVYKATESYSTADNTSVSETSVNTVFKIETPYSIPSDGKQYNVEVQNYGVPAIYEYYCAPRQDMDVFLVAKTDEWDDLNILPGSSSIYFQGTFVGEAFINPNVTKDTLELSLGRDKNIVVERNLLRDYSKSSSIGGKRKVQRGYEIIVRNTRKKEVKLTLVDQVPVSKYDEVEVEIVESSGAKHTEHDGKLRWDISIPAGETKKITFKFEVKADKDYVISNL